MREGDLSLYNDLKEKLQIFEREVSLPGIKQSANLDCLILQIIDSIRRIKYVRIIRKKNPSHIYCDASTAAFDPIKAAVWHINEGNIDEAFWLVFLFTHFGKNKTTGWELIRGLYGALNQSAYWNWDRISTDFKYFQVWLSKHQNELKLLGKFGNHRKYQSIDAYKPAGTGFAIGSYVDWILGFKNHSGLIDHLNSKKITNPKNAFNYLYHELNKVVSFGRTAKFDFLTMVGKLDLINIEPDSTYMNGATGPKTGACLLFGGTNNSAISQANLEILLNKLETHLNLYFGMQVLEDSLCNWQKSPSHYIHFTG